MFGIYKKKKWSLRDSNSPPSDCEPDALPDELRPHSRTIKPEVGLTDIVIREFDN